MYDLDTFKELLAAAGLSKAEAAKIFGTTRPTMYHWCDGAAPTQRVLRDNANRIINLLNKAIAGGSLPLPADVVKEQRHSALVSVLRKQLSN